MILQLEELLFCLVIFMPEREKFDCLAGCIDRYHTPPLWDQPPFLNGDRAENVAPFIWAQIVGGGQVITVGNESYPADPHKAVIKSIDFGFINTNQGKLEIVDEEGGKLSIFLDNAAKCASNVGVTSKIRFRIGWVYTKCDGGNGEASSPIMESTIVGIQSNLSNGLIKFIISFDTYSAFTQQLREDKTYGQEKSGQKQHLEDAIVQLFNEEPSIRVRFGYYNESGQLIYSSLDWVDHGKKGPKSIWHSDSQNRYSVVAKWIEGYRVNMGQNGKGVILINNPQLPDELIVLADPSKSCNEKVEPTRTLGTFIVNGGKCSSVIEFSPTFDFVSVIGHYNTGGSSQGGISTKQSKKEDTKRITCNEQGDKVGTQSQVSPNQSTFSSDGLNAPENTNKASEVHAKAHKLVDVQGKSIVGELRIVGNIFRNFYSLDGILGAFVSIVVINPNHISSNGNGCGDFLKRADCHPFYSNKNWQVQGVNHAIQEGSFVTTLKVTLMLPGVDLSSGNTLGASSTGITVKGTC